MKQPMFTEELKELQEAGATQTIQDVLAAWKENRETRGESNCEDIKFHSVTSKSKINSKLLQHSSSVHDRKFHVPGFYFEIKYLHPEDCFTVFTFSATMTSQENV